jgi:hypothetical protein
MQLPRLWYITESAVVEEKDLVVQIHRKYTSRTHSLFVCDLDECNGSDGNEGSCE